MSAKLKKRLFTVKEYHQMIDIGILTKDDRVELIEGEIIQMPAIGNRRASCAQKLIEVFNKLPENKAIVDDRTSVQLSKQTELQPDLVLLQFREDRLKNSISEASDVLLLIEINDSNIADRDIKIPIYARSTIQEVWSIDLVENSLTVYRQPTLNSYNLKLDLHQGQEIAPIGFPDFTVSVDAILPTINKSIV
ncbi:MAG: Uma2 family endonuclease [Oscillatoriales cyanobacterium RU_3_3]|nr:Uma2 family endonuclease [Oscillatoriales cyanobacterium RU_3_3]